MICYLKYNDRSTKELVVYQFSLLLFFVTWIEWKMSRVKHARWTCFCGSRTCFRSSCFLSWLHLICDEFVPLFWTLKIASNRKKKKKVWTILLSAWILSLKADLKKAHYYPLRIEQKKSNWYLRQFFVDLNAIRKLDPKASFRLRVWKSLVACKVTLLQ